MTTAEKIQLRDKARRDFEGKLYKGKLIFEVGFNVLDSGEVHFTIFDENMCNIYSFAQGHYDRTLKQCTKPFPKDGFSIRLDDNRAEIYNLASYVAKSNNCKWSETPDEPIHEAFPQVTIQELKDEAKRILEL